jgi:hypothetical protein
MVPAYFAYASIYLALSIPASTSVTMITPPVGPENNSSLVPAALSQMPAGLQRVPTRSGRLKPVPLTEPGP